MLYEKHIIYFLVFFVVRISEQGIYLLRDDFKEKYCWPEIYLEVSTQLSKISNNFFWKGTQHG